MKKLFLLVGFFCFIGGMSLNAQCSKTCTKKVQNATSMADQSSNEVSAKMVANIADADPSIEKKVCDYSGAVSYYKKKQCEVSGKTSYTEVNYDAALGQFVNISPSESGAELRKEHSSAAKVMEIKNADGSASKKACCAGACAKDCCKGKKSTSTSEARVIKTSGT